MKSLIERRKLLRDKATELGICVSCHLRDAKEDGRYCTYCSKAHVNQMNKYRAMPDRCSRCGNKNDRAATHKTCTKCCAPKLNKTL